VKYYALFTQEYLGLKVEGNIAEFKEICLLQYSYLQGKWVALCQVQKHYDML